MVNWFEGPYEGLENEAPYMFIRAGKVKTVNCDRTVLGTKTPSEIHKLGTIEVEWLDYSRGNSTAMISFPCFSNPLIDVDQDTYKNSTGVSYGFMYMPSEGDIVICGFRDWTSPVVLGYLPINFERQTSTDTIKDAYWGTIRLLVPGEFSLKSKQQAEIYLDRNGAIQTSIKVQPTKTTQVPSTILAESTIGVAYGNARTSAHSADIIFDCRVNTTPNVVTPTWMYIQVDANGNTYLKSKNNIVQIASDGIFITDGVNQLLLSGYDGLSISASNGRTLVMNLDGIAMTCASAKVLMSSSRVDINNGALTIT